MLPHILPLDRESVKYLVWWVGTFLSSRDLFCDGVEAISALIYSLIGFPLTIDYIGNGGVCNSASLRHWRLAGTLLRGRDDRRALEIWRWGIVFASCSQSGEFFSIMNFSSLWRLIKTNWILKPWVVRSLSRKQARFLYLQRSSCDDSMGRLRDCSLWRSGVGDVSRLDESQKPPSLVQVTNIFCVIYHSLLVDWCWDCDWSRTIYNPYSGPGRPVEFWKLDYIPLLLARSISHSLSSTCALAV